MTYKQWEKMDKNNLMQKKCSYQRKKVKYDPQYNKFNSQSS